MSTARVSVRRMPKEEMLPTSEPAGTDGDGNSGWADEDEGGETTPSGGERPTWYPIAAVVAGLVVVALLSTAPLVFNFVTAMPHFGLAFGRVFEAWSYLLVLVGVSHAFGVSITWAFGFTLAGWLVIQVISRVGQRPFSWVSSHLWTLATGRATMVTSRDILSGTPLIPVSGLHKEVER